MVAFRLWGFVSLLMANALRGELQIPRIIKGGEFEDRRQRSILYTNTIWRKKKMPSHTPPAPRRPLKYRTNEQILQQSDSVTSFHDCSLAISFTHILFRSNIFQSFALLTVLFFKRTEMTSKSQKYFGHIKEITHIHRTSNNNNNN